MLDLYRYNVRLIPLQSACPGDIVFITDGSGAVTHGGLFIGWKGATTLEFVNASSYADNEKVVKDFWPIHGEKRGQRIVGIGRLLVTM